MRWWIGAAALLSTSAALAAPATNEEPKLVEVSADGATLYFAGKLDFPAFLAFSRALGKYPGVKRLVIASQGGEVRAGQLMAASVGMRKLSVHVEHLCASACTLVLMSANERSMGPDAKIGFHKSYWIPEETPDEEGGEPPEAAKADNGKDGAEEVRTTSRRSSLAEAGRVERYGDRTFRWAMEKAGVDGDFTERALATPSADMWYPARDELLAAHVVTRLDDAAAANGPSWAVDRASAGALLAGPLWTALEAKRPLLWSRIVDNVWRDRNAGVPASEAALSVYLNISTDLASDVARAPDALVGRLLTIHAAQAAKIREGGYRSCRLTAETMADETGDEHFMRAEEEAALTEMLLLPKLQKPLEIKKATRIVARFSGANLPDIYDETEDSADFDTDCRDGLHVIETINAAPAKQRVEVYRALLSLFDQ